LTGVIGPFLQMDKIRNGIKDAHSKLALSSGFDDASRAIMTTDSVPKMVTSSVTLRDGESVRFVGMTKGAGMIHPNMATCLAVLLTDASISPLCLSKALKYAVDRSYNCISIDGDTSTNDTFAVLANGLAYRQEHTKTAISDPHSELFLSFRDALTATAIELAKKIVRDGEGATKFVTVEVQNAHSYEDAHRVAASIAKSSLVKTAVFGGDANWGRVLCAVGYSGVAVRPEKINLYLVGDDSAAKSQQQPGSAKGIVATLQLVRDGQPYDPSGNNEQFATDLFRRPEVHIRVDLGIGTQSATYWTCDLSMNYVKINANYRS